VADYRPALHDALGFTKAELRGVKKLADRIRFDLHVGPTGTMAAIEWRRAQQIALRVIEERISNGR
jgi:hypothetical protein